PKKGSVGPVCTKKTAQNTNRTDPAKLGKEDPKYRDDCADGHHMTGGKCGKARPAVKWIEAVNVISDQRRIVLHPRLWPSAAKSKLQPVFEDDRKRQAKCRQYDCDLDLSQSSFQCGPNSEKERTDYNHRTEYVG